MILTLYYMYATFLQWWRLGSLKNKLNGTLNSKNALLVCDESIIFDTKKFRSFENLLFRNENRIGCTVVPKQKINLSSQWVIFPRDVRLFPIYFKSSRTSISKPNIYVLVQAVLDTYNQHQAEILQIENFGELVAWKITDHFEAILKTDMDKLTKLVHCFSQRDCDINHELQLLKVETIDVEGKAKKIKYERKFSKDTTLKYSLAPVHWRKFVADVKDLYSKIRDATNPKITIDNGTPKPEDLKIVPVSEVKPIKKDKKFGENKDKHTLEVNCSDYRRHKSSEHTKKDKEKSSDRHRSEKEKPFKKDTKTDVAATKEEKSKEDHKHKKYKTRDETDVFKLHKKEKEDKVVDVSHKKEKDKTPENGKEICEVSQTKLKGDSNGKNTHKHEKHKYKEHLKKEENADDFKLDKKPIEFSEDAQPSTSMEPKSSEKLKKEGRTSSKEKKLVRSSATCDDPTENEQNIETNMIRKEPTYSSENDQKASTSLTDNNGESNLADDQHYISPSDSNGCMVNQYIVKNVKPPNILVYADSTIAKDNVKEVLHRILNRDRYTIYDLPLTKKMPWNDSTTLIVVCGSVEPNLTFNLMKYLLTGGQLLCLCSDLLYSVLYTFTTAEVREHELVRFSYGKWKNVKMMHHIFCYQASPAKKQFSKDSDTSNHSSGNDSSPIAPKTPSTVDIQHGGKNYTIQVQILGTEETWQTPSLMLATVRGSEGRAVFSQVHLEINPDEYVDDENKFEALKDSNQARIDILKDILCNHLNLDCNHSSDIPAYTTAYFLGRHDLKISMLNESHCIKDKKLKAGEMQVLFCGKDDKYDEPSNTFLPISIHSCPQNFSTVNYFETLNTKYLGRLVIYSDVLPSTHTILTNNQLTHGVAVICRQQVAGIGRSKNVWLSPPGSAMFSLQLHIPLISNLGKTLSIIQHLQMTAIVKTIKKLTNKKLAIGIKWPNDLYANASSKIGGLIVTSVVLGDFAIANIGCGVNLNNSNPTTCVNDVVKQFNLTTDSNIPEITYEQYFAEVFNETEELINRYQMGDIDYFFDNYYDYWLHK